MALKKGDRAPDFSLYDTDKKIRTLGEFLGHKTVIAFYPGAFTGVCTKEMCTFRDSLGTLGTLHAQVVGISVDSPFANKSFAEQNKLGFPLLTDFSREVSKKYCGLYEDFAGLKSYTAAKRSVFVLDTKGIVQYAWISDQPGVEPPYEEVNRALGSI
ncbi:MAG TPA: peroxiredoxin [Bacteroidota bacterium]|nr:peroxiredoxin [Bacteroidota bacterium]